MKRGNEDGCRLCYGTAETLLNIRKYIFHDSHFSAWERNGYLHKHVEYLVILPTAAMFVVNVVIFSI
jgi:hypothetical protein